MAAPSTPPYERRAPLFSPAESGILIGFFDGRLPEYASRKIL